MDYAERVIRTSHIPAAALASDPYADHLIEVPPLEPEPWEAFGWEVFTAPGARLAANCLSEIALAAVTLDGRPALGIISACEMPTIPGCGLAEAAGRMAAVVKIGAELDEPPLVYPPACPPHGACYAVRLDLMDAMGWVKGAPLVENWARAVAAGWEAVAVPTALVHAAPEAPPSAGSEAAAIIAARRPQAQRLDPRPTMVRQARRVRVKDGRPRVYFWSQHAQHCGGLISQVELVNRLCERGINASLVLSGDGEGDWARYLAEHARFTPIFLPGQDAEKWLAAGGSHEGLVLTSNFFSGRAVLDLCARFPGLRPRVYPQGRDDLMTHDNGTPRWSPDAFADYFAILQEHGGVVNGRWVAESLARDLGLDTSKLHHVPVGVDTTVYRPAPEKRPTACLRVLAMHREHSPERGTPMLRRVLERAAALPRVEVLTYGNSPTMDAGPSNIPGVRHLGVLTQREVVEWCQASHMLIDCSRPTGHGAGMSAMEMAATGGMVIRTPSLGLDEILSDGKTCLVHADEDCMSWGIEWWLRHPREREEVGAMARAHLVEHFDWEVVTDRFAAWVRTQ